MGDELKLFRIHNPREHSSYAYLPASSAREAIRMFAEQHCIESMVNPEFPIIQVEAPKSNEMITLYAVEPVIVPKGYEIHITPLEQKVSSKPPIGEEERERHVLR